jgi:NADPH:quinone reductase-like Zn-dependent oxidoreductase
MAMFLRTVVDATASRSGHSLAADHVMPIENRKTFWFLWTPSPVFATSNGEYGAPQKPHPAPLWRNAMSTMSRGLAVVAPGSLELRERSLRAPGPDEAIVRLTATSLNFHDLVGVRGGLRGLPVPRVPFSDGCGEVTAVGDNVTRVKPGDRVIPNFFPRWIAGPPTPEALGVVYGDQIDGCLQTHAVLQAQSLVLAPPHLGDTQAATLGCAGVTAWRSLREADVTSGDTVVVQGTGGVSLYALLLAKALGARVIVTSSSDAKLERCGRLGADETINYATTPDWARRVLEITDGRGADHILDVGGQQTLPQSLRAARMGGAISVIGVLTGAEAAEVPVRAVMSKNLRIRGVTVGSRKDLEDLVRAMSANRLEPVLDSEIGLEEVPQALSRMERQGHFGKIAVRL